MDTDFTTEFTEDTPACLAERAGNSEPVVSVLSVSSLPDNLWQAGVVNHFPEETSLYMITNFNFGFYYYSFRKLSVFIRVYLWFNPSRFCFCRMTQPRFYLRRLPIDIYPGDIFPHISYT